MSRFQMPTEPKNGLDLLRWVIFEQRILRRFNRKTLYMDETLPWLVKTFPYIIFLSVAVYIGSLIIVAIFDFPSHFPQFYEKEFITSWQLITKWHQDSTVILRIVWLFFQTKNDFFSVLPIFSLSIAFLFFEPGRGLVYALSFGLGFGLFSSLTSGFGGVFVIDHAFGLVFGLALGIVLEIGPFELIFGLFFGLVFVLVFGLSGGINGEVAIPFGFGLIFIPAFNLIYFRLPFYPFYFVYGVFAHNFERNPYLKDGSIPLPLFLLDKQLIRLAYEQPDKADEFAEFLLEYRPLQYWLAAKIPLAANAGRLRQQAVELNADALVLPSFPEDEDLVKFHPSVKWQTNLVQLRTQLVHSQTQSQIGLKKAAFERFFKLLKKFRKETILESSKWNNFYLDAIDVWLKVSEEYLNTLKQQAELFEPITSSIYKPGDALHVEFDQTIFVGRDDLKDALSFEILTARQMPLFLIQGQRRVGKTSLLNFLPHLLGPRFKIVPIDLQGLGDRTVHGWLLALTRAIIKAFGGQSFRWNPAEDWLKAWEEFRKFVERKTTGKDFKLVLAFDEYEILHDDILQRDPPQAARLLGAMRSFSQQQNQVVFLFAGARFFSELQQPNWNEYFVQVKHLRVDYLKRPDVLHLIQRPTPDFGLVYADDLANRIFDLTQGHPALAQQICSEMVNLANMTNHRNMTHDDLTQVLAEKTLFWENLTIQIFWTQFCSPADRATVKQILAGTPPTDPVSRYRLELHGYIVKDGDGWKMRVPLFEEWLRKFIETFPL